MAVKGGVRWKPDSYKTTLETTVANFAPEGVTVPDGEGGETTDPRPHGTVVMIAQAVAYEDTDFTAPGSYQPGHPDTECKLVILYEEPIMKELAAFHDMTPAEAEAEWESALEDFKNRVLPAGPALVKAIRAARMAPPILID